MKMPDLLRRLLRKKTTSEQIAACLAAAQDDVQAGLSWADYYGGEYRHRELNYWQHVPGWIAGLPNGIRVLDVGAAYSTLAVFTRRLLRAEVTIVDVVAYYQPAALLAAEGIRHLTRNIELGDITDIGPFDLIVFTEILEHLNFNPAPTLRKLHDALVPGGTFMLSTPDAASNWGRITKYYESFADLPQPDPNAAWIDDHIWQYDRAEAEGALAAAGFAIRDSLISPGNDGCTHLNIRAVRPA